MDPDTQLDKSYSDIIISRYKQLLENQRCFDCNIKNPQWFSTIFGIFLCTSCASDHKKLPIQTNLKSIDIDLWTPRELCYIEYGGNKKARDYFNIMNNENKIDYTSNIATSWKNELAKEVNSVHPLKITQSDNTNTAIIITNNNEEKKQDIKPIIFKPALPQNTSNHKFKKIKNEEIHSDFIFKPVVFKSQEQQELFSDPLPLIAPAKQIIDSNENMIQPVCVKAEKKQIEKKAFSSDDFEDKRENNRGKERLALYANAKAISSDMIFNGNNGNKIKESKGEIMKEKAAQVAHSVADKAENLKFKAINAIKKLQNKFKKRPAYEDK
ncbi:unnamed protein product [Blepharisma stoltei]|uniref:Arf-GAP domain-containing protein n=1 Tax=Blepharisma stoltei TaxID=1481888 RepID=A0AAU9IUD6_9CILI|nr:unnamed protein product [Blepharisma stoltei]